MKKKDPPKVEGVIDGPTVIRMDSQSFIKSEKFFANTIAFIEQDGMVGILMGLTGFSMEPVDGSDAMPMFTQAVCFVTREKFLQATAAFVGMAERMEKKDA